MLPLNIMFSGNEWHNFSPQQQERGETKGQERKSQSTRPLPHPPLHSPLTTGLTDRTPKSATAASNVILLPVPPGLPRPGERLPASSCRPFILPFVALGLMSSRERELVSSLMLLPYARNSGYHYCWFRVSVHIQKVQLPKSRWVALSTGLTVLPSLG